MKRNRITDNWDVLEVESTLKEVEIPSQEGQESETGLEFEVKLLLASPTSRYSNQYVNLTRCDGFTEVVQVGVPEAWRNYFDKNTGGVVKGEVAVETFDRQALHKEYETEAFIKVSYCNPTESMPDAEGEFKGMLEGMVASAIFHRLQDYEEEVMDHRKAEEDAKDANYVLNTMRNLAHEKAKAVMRYNQRLAALNAELEEELKVQAQEIMVGVEELTIFDPSALPLPEHFVQVLNDHEDYVALRKVGHPFGESNVDPVTADEFLDN